LGRPVGLIDLKIGGDLQVDLLSLFYLLHLSPSPFGHRLPKKPMPYVLLLLLFLLRFFFSFNSLFG
jgi:hypothetical protein